MAKTQWHPAFCAAMRLELKNDPTLQFADGFNLTELPLEVDLLIIHKPSDVEIDNQIGEFFSENNLLEYKSPTDHGFNQYGLYQALSYAFYCCDRYQTMDVTVSLVTSKAHFNMMKWIAKREIQYKKRHSGIYELQGLKQFLKVQVVVTEELNGDVFCWLSSLTDNLTEEKAKKLITTAYGLAESRERRLAEAVMQVLTSANGKLFEKIKEDEFMASALMELMKPEVEEYAKDYAEKYADNRERKHDMERARVMISRGENNAYIRLLTQLTDEEIDELRNDDKM